MSLMHKRGLEVLVGMALAVAVLAVLPAVAEAQDMAETQGANRGAEAAGSMVVSPGDSLWSISEEHLDPNATPRRTFARSPWLHQGAPSRNEGDYDGSGKAFAGTREPTSQPESLVGRRREAADPNTKRALLVAKHAVFRECLALILEWRTDFQVAWAESLGEARRVLRNLDVEPDLAVVDLELPDGDGIELIDGIREMWPRVSVLALSTGRNLERLARAKQAGADAVLTMAAGSDEILEKVRLLENG